MKRGLQIILVILSLIPLYYGAQNLILGAAALSPEGRISPSLDSQFRFLSAYYLGLVFIIWYILPNIENHTGLFRLVIGALFLGGLGRLYSYFAIGAPPSNMVFGMVLELCLPLLIIWQAKIRS